METRSAALVGVATFIVGVILAALLFSALNVEWIFLFGPLVGIGLAAYAAYRTALQIRR